MVRPALRCRRPCGGDTAERELAAQARAGATCDQAGPGTWSSARAACEGSTMGSTGRRKVSSGQRSTPHARPWNPPRHRSRSIPAGSWPKQQSRRSCRPTTATRPLESGGRNDAVGSFEQPGIRTDRRRRDRSARHLARLAHRQHPITPQGLTRLRHRLPGAIRWATPPSVRSMQPSPFRSTRHGVPRTDNNPRSQNDIKHRVAVAEHPSAAGTGNAGASTRMVQLPAWPR